jgi:uncharacterized protein YlzI (FlbEa/FlbD family)
MVHMLEMDALTALNGLCYNVFKQGNTTPRGGTIQMPEVVTQLSPQLISQLNKETLVLLCTMDAEHGSPMTNAISWVYAVNASTLRLALDGRSRIVANIRANERVNATIFAEGTVQVICGKAKIVSESLEDVPFTLVCMDIAIDSVRDGMFYGARISAEPAYEKTYDLRAAKKLDDQVFAAMKKA